MEWINLYKLSINKLCSGHDLYVGLDAPRHYAQWHLTE